MENKIMEAMSCLDCQLVQEASRSAWAKRRWPRTLVLAACLAVLCALSVAAAGGIFGNEQWSLFFENSGTPGAGFVVQATYGGTVLPEQQAEALKAAAETGHSLVSDDGVIHIVHDVSNTFDSIGEIETYLEIDLLETPLKTVEECFFRAVYAEEQDALYIDVYYRPESVVNKEAGFVPYIQIEAYLCTAEGVTMSMLSSLEENAEISEYPIKNLGVTAYLIENHRWQGRASGYFNVDGIAYEVSALGEAQDMQQILETFQ